MFKCSKNKTKTEAIDNSEEHDQFSKPLNASHVKWW